MLEYSNKVSIHLPYPCLEVNIKWLLKHSKHGWNWFGNQKDIGLYSLNCLSLIMVLVFWRRQQSLPLDSIWPWDHNTYFRYYGLRFDQREIDDRPIHTYKQEYKCKISQIKINYKMYYKHLELWSRDLQILTFCQHLCFHWWSKDVDLMRVFCTSMDGPRT